MERNPGEQYSYRVCTVLIPSCGGGVFGWDDCGARFIADTCTRDSFFVPAS